MKIEAASRLQSWVKPDKPNLELKVYCSDSETLQTLVNLLGVIQWNGMVGHSALVGSFFDGDGAGQVRIEGLPKGDYAEIGEALASYGDGHLAEVGPNSARGWNTVHPEEITEEHAIVKPTKVWPPE